MTTIQTLPKTSVTIAALVVSAGLLSCATSQQQTVPTQVETSIPRTLFSETTGVLPSDERARRKWDGAMVGDLDGDGYQDLILTEHAHQVHIYWNEGGRFSEPQTLINGDMHGTGIADFDGNGLVEIVIAQGGGNGSNPRKPIHFEVSSDRTINTGEVLSHFEKGRGRSIKAFDANQNGDLDLFLTGFAMASQFKTGANHFYSNDGNGDFTFLGNLPHSERLSYKSAIIDYNGDGDQDVFIFGGGAMVVAKAGEGYEFTQATQEVLGELAKTNHVSAVAPIDFDGDGDLDLAISRAKHQFEHQRFYDEQHQRFAFFARFQPFDIGELTIEGDFLLENLQMAYPDFDIYVGADKQKIDIKGRNAITSHDWDLSGENSLNFTQQEAMGFPDDVCVEGQKIQDLPEGVNTGLYIGYVGNKIWRLCSQTRSATAGVINNVIDAPASSYVKPLPAMLLENQNGTFVDVTQAMGIHFEAPTTSAVAADFNNDGWQDLLYMPYGNMAKIHTPIVYLNHQGAVFKQMADHGIVITDLGATGSGVDVIDYDKDGDLDIVTANERGRWRLFENHSDSRNANHFIGVTVHDAPSGNATKLGAKATVSACGNVWERRVGDTSSAYAVAFNNDLLFGLGDCEKVDKITVEWTNGETVELFPKASDQYISTSD